MLALLAQAILASGTPSNGMTSEEVTLVITQAISRARQIESESKAIIAVVDREGYVLAVWNMAKTPDVSDELANLKLGVAVLDAITKAGTAAFLSSNGHAFTSRTAGFIVQQHFPPGVQNRPNGPLVGVNFSNMAYSDVNRFKNPHDGYDPRITSGTNGAAIVVKPFNAVSGLAGSPGGVPLYRNGKLIGGVGVAGQTVASKANPFSILADIQLQSQQRYDPDEDVSLAGQRGFEPTAAILGNKVFIDGISVPYVVGGTRLGEVKPLGSIGRTVKPYKPMGSPKVDYPTDIFGGQRCEIRATIIDDPERGKIHGENRLSVDEVDMILSQASARAKITRAGIRLPGGKAAQTFIVVVNNPALPNTAPAILGTIRTPDATLFSWDVAVQKARTAIFFSNNSRAFSSRTVGFLSQQFFPPGIANTAPGPFYGLQERYSLLPHQAPNAFTFPLKETKVKNALNGVMVAKNDELLDPNPYLPNGITIFPGGFPLYRNGIMIGAIGVSGDGIDQDDIIAAAGTVGFLPPAGIRADRLKYQGARLPYAKFPRNPDL